MRCPFVEQSILHMQRKLLVALALVVGAIVPAFAQQPVTPSPGADGAYYEYVLGLHLEAQGDAAGATAAYQRAEKLDPHGDIPPRSLSVRTMNQPTDAVPRASGLSKPIRTTRGKLDLKRTCGWSSSRAPATPIGRLTRARWATSKTDENAHPGVPLMLSRLYLATHQFDKVSLLRTLIADEPDNSDAVEMLAEAYQPTVKGRAIALFGGPSRCCPSSYDTLVEVDESSRRRADAPRTRGRLKCGPRTCRCGPNGRPRC